MSKLTILLILCMTLIAIAVGFYLAPGKREIALMKMEDSNFNDAMRYYKNLQAQGDSSINVRVPLVKLNMHYGDVDQAIELMKAYVKENPRSIEGLKKLAELYKASQRFYKYCDTLEKLQELVPSGEILRELANTYDFLGKYQDEMRTMSKLIRARDYKPKEEDYMKLASFLRIENHPVEAIATLASYIDSHDYKVGIPIIELASRLQLEMNNEKQALILVNTYLNKRGQEKDFISLSLLFQQYGKLNSAYALLLPVLPNMNHSPKLMQQVVNVQLARGMKKEIYDFLSYKFSQKELPDLLTTIVFDLSMEQRNFVLVKSILNDTQLEDLPDDALLRYADFSVQYDRPDLAIAIKQRLSKEYLHKSMLLAAVLNVAADDKRETLDALYALPKNLIILPTEKMIIARIYLKHGQVKPAFRLLEDINATDMLLTFDSLQFAELYLKMKKADEGIKVLAASLNNNPQLIRDKINNTILLLNIGMGKINEVKKWLKGNPGNNKLLLADAYWLASQYKQNGLALIFAKQIYKENPSHENRLQLAYTLLKNYHYSEALTHLKVLAECDSDARSIYFAALSDWVKSARTNYDEQKVENINNFVSYMLRHYDLSKDEKRSIVYVLAENGFRNKAELIFLELAAGGKFSSPGVTELLSFWDRNLTVDNLSWIESRARKAEGIDKAQWLSYLNASGNPNSVINVMSDQSLMSLPQQVADQYINALVVTRNHLQLSAVMAQQIQQETDRMRLKELALLAKQEEIYEVSEQGWRKLAVLDPNDSDASKELGLLAFANNNYSEAQKFLEQYLKSNEGNYKINYTFAEVLRNKMDKRAKKYYEKALQQVSSMAVKDVNASIDQALLLFRNDRLKDSLTLFRKLLKDHPDNKILRSTFAKMLIETENYKEASLVLPR